MIVAGRGWHPGVIGIVAGRLKEKTGRPVMVIAIDEDGIGKGSGRSITGVDLGAAILAAEDSGLLVAGGGHAMAAGLTVEAERIEALRDFLDERLAAAVARRSGPRPAPRCAAGAGRPHARTCRGAGRRRAVRLGWPAPRVPPARCGCVKGGSSATAMSAPSPAGDDGRASSAIAFRSAATALGQALLARAPPQRCGSPARSSATNGGRNAAELHSRTPPGPIDPA